MPNTASPANGEALPRHKIERAIAALIDLLDTLDGDSDLEPNLTGTEPKWDDAEGDDCDMEPIVGWTESVRQEGDGWSGRESYLFDCDREHDEEREWDQAEDGIADQDGLAEQFAGIGLVFHPAI